jgi:hypothetical protein
MYVIKPNPINDAALVSSTVPETDHPAWNPATSYTVGDRVIRATTHKVYEAILAGANAGLPENTPARWVAVGSTNRWRMLDSEVGSVTSAPGSLSVVLAPGYATALALLEVDAQSISVTVTSPDTIVAVPTPHNMLARSEQLDSTDAWASNAGAVTPNAVQRPASATYAHNLIPRSQELTLSPWEIGPALTPNGQVGTLGGVPAWQFTSNGIGSSYLAQKLALTPGAVYTATFLCDRNSGGYSEVVFLGAATGSPNIVVPYVVTTVFDPASYGSTPHNLLLGSGATVWGGAAVSGQSNVASVAVPALFSGAVVQLATRGSGGDTNVSATRTFGIAGTVYTAHCYVWLPSGQTYTDVVLADDGTLLSAVYTRANLSLRDQWQRISVTGVLASTDVLAVLRPTCAAGTILYHTAWGVNLGPTATAYVPTTGGYLFRYTCTFRFPTALYTEAFFFVGRVDTADGTAFRATAVQLNLGPDVLSYAPTTTAAIPPLDPTADLASATGAFGGPAQTVTLTGARTYTASAYFKRADAGAFAYITILDLPSTAVDCWFNLTTGAFAVGTPVGSLSNARAGVESLAGGWYRCWLTVDVSSTALFTALFRPASASGASSAAGDRCYVFGAQVAQGNAPLDYVPTAASPVGTPGATTPTLVPGAVTYTTTRSLDPSVLLDWYAYFFTDPVSRSEIVFPGLYIGTGYTVSVTLTGATVECGALVIGEATDLGATEYGATLGIVDYSRKETDEFGVVTITRRKYAKRLTAKLAFERERTNRVFRTLAALRSTPCVYVTSDARDYESLTVFGFYKDFRIDVAYPTHHYCTLDIEGLI